jgi:hypothetical protein
VTSEDGAVSFTLRTCKAGLHMERTRRPSRARRVIHAIEFSEESKFVRWCDADRLQFTYPLVFARLRRSGCALFHDTD